MQKKNKKIFKNEVSLYKKLSKKKKNILNLFIFSKNSANIKSDQNYLQWLYSSNLFKWNINSIQTSVN